MNEHILSLVINLISSAIYDFTKDKATAMFPFRSKADEKNKEELTKSIQKSVCEKLGELIKEGGIFDCDAMQNYLKYMNPVQKICRHTFEPLAAGSSEDMLRKLAEDNIQYLRDSFENNSDKNRKTVSIPDESEIKDFYHVVYEICVQAAAAILNPEDRALAALLSAGSEQREERAATLIEKGNKEINAKLDRHAAQIQERLNSLILGGTDSKITLSPNMLANLEKIPYKYQEGSEKTAGVKQITTSLSTCFWVHIYGKVFSGKTQLLIRVAERLASYIWLNVTEEVFEHISVMSLDAPEDTVVILDGVPNLEKPSVRDKCLQILSECKEKKYRLLTSGYESAEQYIRGFTVPGEVISTELTGLSEDEIREIMKRHQAPEEIFAGKPYHSFVEICKNLPPVVMEVIYRMKENGWKYDDDVFMTVVQRKTDTIEKQMKHLFLDSVTEENARRLYYRMLYASCPVDRNWVQPIAAVPEPVAQPDRSLERLKNRWLYSEGKYYQFPNTILQAYAEEQLKPEEKSALNRFLVEETVKHPLGPLEITNLLLYYARLENYDGQGILCYQLMEQMMEHGVKEYIVHAESFWQETPLPEKMSPMIKVLLRAEQLYFKIWRGDEVADFRKKKNELWALVSEDRYGYMLIVTAGMRMAGVNSSCSLSLFEDFMEICHGESRDFEQIKGSAFASGEVRLPDFLQDNSLFTAYNQILGIHICCLSQLEYYLDILERYFTPGHWSELEAIDGMDIIIQGMLERVRADSEDQRERYKDAVKRWYSMLDAVSMPVLWRGVLYSLLYAHQMDSQYEEAKRLYCSVEKLIEAEPAKYVEVIDVMARIAHDNGDRELERRLFRWEMQELTMVEKTRLTPVYIDSALLYLEQLTGEDGQETEQVRTAMRYLAGNLSPRSEYPRIQEKMEAEYWMKLCQTESLSWQMEEFLLFVEQLLESYGRGKDVVLNSILTKMCHVLGYISGKLLRDEAPEKLPDGGEYTGPKLRIFWNDIDDNDVIQYWKPEKRELLYYICAELADRYGFAETGNRLFGKMSSAPDFWSKLLEPMYRMESYMPLKFLERGEIALLAHCMHKMYEPQERQEIERNGEFFYIVREQMILSLFIMKLYRKNRNSAIALCERLIECVKEEEYSETGRNYYGEYKKILGLVVREDADFDLLKEAFLLVQKKKELTNMDSALFPLLLLRAPAAQEKMLKKNTINAIKMLRFEHDFKMEEMIRFIED